MTRNIRLWHRVLLAIGVAGLFRITPLMAQQPVPWFGASPTPRGTSGNDHAPRLDALVGDPTQDTEKQGEEQVGSNDRLFWALPNFLTVENAEHVPPLTAKQKFDVTTRSTFDLVEFGWWASLAGIDHLEHGEPTYGQGAEGYGKRWALAVGDGAIENFMVTAVFASTFRQDPRYYQLGRGSAWHRTGYSISRIVVTRSDRGHAQFNFSEILGSALAAGLYNTYHPVGDRTVSHTLTSWGSQVGYDTISIVVKEFWPDIRDALHKHH